MAGSAAVGVLIAGLISPLPAAAATPDGASNIQYAKPGAPAGAHKGAGTLQLPTIQTTDGQGRAVIVHSTVTVKPKPHASRTSRADQACKQAWGQVYYQNIFGNRIADYTMTIDWCYEGNKVVSISPIQTNGTVYAWAAALGWSYAGVREKSQWDYYGDKWVYRSYSQGAFDYCPPRIICIQHKYPQIWLDTFGDGHYDFYWNSN